MKEFIFLIVLFIANIIQAITGFVGTVLAMPASMFLLGIDDAKVVLNVMALISVAILLLLIVPGSPAFMAPQSFVALVAWIVLGVIFYFCSRKKFMVVTKREMDYLILGNVQVVRGVRKGQKQSDIVQGNIVNPK